ncbi:hypothetical protein [Paraburkholderia terrae]|uniref:hypothetical protein n=1 Tax=Paraburkholderia terrae TaxID=311230 RepID=UPI0012DFEE5D|nr:hypothetical protein [Paraburkholderia terrae]
MKMGFGVFLSAMPGGLLWLLRWYPVWFFWAFRWHPRYGVCRSRVAPVRGGTYFSLPPQRKVGKRKRLTPPILISA